MAFKTKQCSQEMKHKWLRNTLKYSTSSAIRNIQIKNHFDILFYWSQNRQLRLTKQKTVHASKDSGKGEHYSVAGGNTNWYSWYGSQCGVSSGSWELVYPRFGYSTLGHIPKGFHILVQKTHAHPCSYCCMHNNQKLGTAQMFIN